MDETTKIYLSYIKGYSNDTATSVAIDVKTTKMYIGISEQIVDYGEDPAAILGESGVRSFFSILEECGVQKWDEKYGSSDDQGSVDQYGWDLRIERKDLTIEEHAGMAQTKEECVPDDFDEFIAKVDEFVNQYVSEDSEK